MKSTKIATMVVAAISVIGFLMVAMTTGVAATTI
jgi:hypothetical protein